jgi:hypothetical protein
MERVRSKKCHLCLGQHDEEIHEATLRIRSWLRREILTQIAPWTRNPERPPEVLKN